MNCVSKLVSGENWPAFWAILMSLGVLTSGCTASDSTIQLFVSNKVQPVTKPLKHNYTETAAGKYLAGRFARRHKDFHNAARLLMGALSLDAKNRRIRHQAFLSMLAGGDIDQAAKLAETIVSEDKNATIAELTMVVEQARANKITTALYSLANMPKGGMNAFTGPLLRAWLHYGEGNQAEAIAALDELLKIKTFTALRSLHVGLILDLSGDAVAAEIALKESFKIASSIRTVQAYGRFLERNGRAAEAKGLYQDFVSNNGGSDTLDADIKRATAGELVAPLVSGMREGLAEVFFNLSGTLAQGQSADLALIYGRFALRLRPDFPMAQILLGGLLESIDRKNEALELYDAINPSSPLFWSGRMRKAEALDGLKRTDEAIGQLRVMAQERQADFKPLMRMGDMQRSQKRYQEAVVSYSEALARVGKLNKSHWSLLYSRGIAYERSNLWAKAEVDFLRALELSPEQPFILNYLGYSWVDRGINLHRAKSMIDRAVQLRPNNAYIVDSLGWVLYQLGNYVEAARLLERAVILRPEDPTINEHLGDAYWRVGRILEARFQWHRALSLDPEKNAIRSIEKKLQHGLSNAPRKDSRI